MEVLIVGASARALAQSAVRARFRPMACDLFADWDLMQFAPVNRIAGKDYPAGFLNFVRQHPGVPVAYTGGLENFPDLLAEIASINSLMGNNDRVIRRLRDPSWLGRELDRAGFDYPKCALAADHLPTDGTWLMKPLASAGGGGIRPWTGGPLLPGHYWQELRPGVPHAAVFVGDHDGARLLGMTRQWVGDPDSFSPPFGYAGSVGPIRTGQDAELKRLGNLLVQQGGARGVFGVDCLLDEDHLVVIEVNPRYPASAEVLENALGVSMFAEHARAFGFDEGIAPAATADGMVHGKAILFADRDCRLPEDSLVYRDWGAGAIPRYADIPVANAQLPAGAPVLTVLARGQTHDECAARLRKELSRARQMLEPAARTTA